MGEPKRSRLGIAAGMVLFCVIVLWAGLRFGSMLRALRDPAPMPMPLPALILLLAVVTFLALLAHEAGHIAGARSAGFQFQLLTIGPCTWIREGERIQFRWNRELVQAGGLSAALPVPGADVRRGVMRMIVGGPLASLALSLAGAALWATTTGNWSLTGVIFALQSLAIAAATLVPSAMGGYVSDGARFLQLRRGDMEGNRWVAIATYAGLAQAGLRPREWPPVPILDTWADGSADGVVLASMLYFVALDHDRIGEAGQWLDRMTAGLASVPASLRPALLIDAAWFQATHRGDAAGARAWLNDVQPSPFVPAWSRLRAEAAVLHAEGRAADAAATRVQAATLLDRLPASGITAFERELLQVVP